MEKKNINPESIEAFGKEKEQQQEQTVVNKFNEKNYLNVKLDTAKGELSKEIKIRILPIDSNSDSAFQVIHMHYVKVNKKISKNGFKNYICLKKTSDIDVEHYGKKCPFCEINQGAWDKYKEVTDKDEKEKWRQLANENAANEYAIIRCIERGHEEDGPKFWKFGLRSDEKDPMHSIIKLFKTRKNESIEEKYGEDFFRKPQDEQNRIIEEDGFEPANILDIYTGKDLKLTINAVRNKNGELTEKVTIDIADYGSSKPLAKTEETIEQWVNDPKLWSDVFTVKPYEYLDIVSKGGIPYFDKKENKWVEWIDKDSQNKKVTEEELEVTNDIKESASAAKQMDVVKQDVDGDLPF